MQYFSAQTAIDLERIKIVDMSREDKNLLPAIHNFRTVLAFLDAGQNGIFYKLWDAGLGDCDVWLGEALTPDGKPIRPGSGAHPKPGGAQHGANRPEQRRHCGKRPPGNAFRPARTHISFIVATGHLESEIQDLLAVNPRMRFVVYTLELNILAKVPALFEKYGIHDTEITQIAVSKLDADNRFRPQPSPWLIAGAV